MHSSNIEESRIHLSFCQSKLTESLVCPSEALSTVVKSRKAQSRPA